jgi:transcriptional regulator with XRE-family HTH domain
VTVSPFGAYLRERRTSAGVSLRSVADELGISHVYLGEVERGRRRLLPDKYWERLSEVVPGITVDELRAMAAASAPLDPSSVEGPGREVVVALARRLEEDGLSDDVAGQILRLLEKG